MADPKDDVGGIPDRMEEAGSRPIAESGIPLIVGPRRGRYDQVMAPNSASQPGERLGLHAQRVGFWKGRSVMSVAKIIEITCRSDKSFEDAIEQGVARATKTVQNVEGAWIKEQKVVIENGRIVGYQVDMKVTFVLKDKE